MFKKACEDFAEKNDLKIILTKKDINESTSLHEGKFHFYFYKEIDGVKVPASVTFKSFFNKHTSRKVLSIDANFPFPIKDIIEVTHAYTQFMNEHFVEFFKELDVDRLRKITNGKDYQGHTVDNERDLGKLLERFKKADKPFTDKQLESIYTKMSSDLLKLPRDATGEDERFLIVHGEKGRQFGEKLEENMLCAMREIHENVYCLELLFPFEKGAKSRHLSGFFLREGAPRWLREKGLVCFMMSEDEVRQYSKKDK